MSDDRSLQSRRNALKCLAFGGAGTLFALSGGVFTPIDLAAAADDRLAASRVGKPLFVQISDTHIGFDKDANPDVSGTLTQTIDLVNTMPEQPALVIHTGDITHLSKPTEFDLAQQLLARLRTTELHTTPGEHDMEARCIQSLLAEDAGAVGVGKGHHDDISGLQSTNVGADCFDDADRLVPHPAALIGRFHELVRPKVAAANAGMADCDERVGRLHQPGVGDVLDANIASSIHNGGAHVRFRVTVEPSEKVVAPDSPG